MNRGRGRGGFASRGGRGRGGANTSKPQPGPGVGGKTTTPDSVPMDVVRPVLPPLYPEYSDGARCDFLDNSMIHLAPDFIHFNEYLRTNYAINPQKKMHTGFEIEKYTDAYEEPLKVPAHLHYTLDKRFFPKELCTKSNKLQAKRAAKVIDTKDILQKYSIKEEKGAVDSDDESDSEKKPKLAKLDPSDAENLELKNAAKSLDPELGDGDDDDDDDVDEELDEGNDYMNDYFDNGEGYLSEDEALEEGDVF